MARLHLGDNLAAHTAPAQLLDWVHADSGDALELLRDLAVARRQACGRECLRMAETATTEHHLQWFGTYLSLLQRFAGTELVGQLHGSAQAAFQWSSPLSSPPAASQLYCFNSITAEQLLACHMYAAVLQEHAFLQAGGTPKPSPSQAAGASGSPSSAGKRRSIKDLLPFKSGHSDGRPGSPGQAPASSGSPASSPYSSASPASSSPAAASDMWAAGSGTSSCSTPRDASPTTAGQQAAAASGEATASVAGELHAGLAALYRRAAGVFDHISTRLLPELQAAQGLPADPPVELWPGVSEAMCQLCLAQAQGVAAERAEAKGTSPALVAALHMGAAGLFERALGMLAAVRPPVPGSQRTISGRVTRFLSLSTLWHQAAAHQQMAVQARAQQGLGLAVAAMSCAVHHLEQALKQCTGADKDWRLVLAARLAACQRLLHELDRERSVVHMQQVAPAAPQLPEGRVIVAPIKFTLAHTSSS